MRPKLATTTRDSHADGTPCAGATCTWQGPRGHELPGVPTPEEGALWLLEAFTALAETAPSLRCVEADALADLYYAYGRAQDARTLLDAHSYGDDDVEDAHHRRYLELRGQACPVAGCLSHDVVHEEHVFSDD